LGSTTLDRLFDLGGDVTDDAAVEALAAGAVREFGRLDVWVNNAGGSPIQAPLVELPREEWDATLRLNLTAIWVCTTIAAKHMQDGGRVINISSRAAEMTVPGSGHYTAAKAAAIERSWVRSSCGSTSSAGSSASRRPCSRSSRVTTSASCSSRSESSALVGVGVGLDLVDVAEKLLG
jgi:NADP-dependent 3-hydroxy acid dehydrogenase YdfG